VIGLGIHEAGHVWAMLRSGMKVRGMYLVPLLGALTVSEDAFTTRRQQAYVALNGPVWGAASAFAAAGLWLATREPVLASVAAWWALLNLLNLLPVVPLDGGRVLQAFAFSFSSSLGVALCVLGLAGAVAVATWLGYGLLWLVAGLGAVELLSESSMRAGGAALRLLPEPARFGPAHFRYLRGLAGPPLGSPSEPLFLRNLQRVQQAAHAAPLTARELVLWGLAYACLAALLVALVHFLGTVPGGAGPGALLG
jgi:Zn-dependent protease